MGQVYRAVHRKMKREVALKVISPALLKDAHAIDRFNREVEAAAKLSHPNIVTAFDAGEVDGVHFLVMEYIAGTDLSTYVRRHGMRSLPQAIELTLQAAQGLAYAHSQSIIHRDIKPSNLLLGHDDSVRVLDLGLARIVPTDDRSITDGLTSTGVVMGTVDFMAPEQALDSKAADARSDIYSLGCTMYYLICGQSVYDGDTVMKRILAHREQPIPDLSEISPNATPRLQSVFAKMLAKEPVNRFESMNDVIQELEAVLPELSRETDNRPRGHGAVSLAPTTPATFDPIDESAKVTMASATFDDTVRPAEPGPQVSLPHITAAMKPKRRTSAGRGRIGSKALALASGGFFAMFLLGAIVFNFTSPDGTVMVELDGPIEVASVKVDGNEVICWCRGSAETGIPTKRLDRDDCVRVSTAQV
ncbi:Serine/threonine-protein kinase PknB [Novipirellula aureliae]|uniref:Serine/threonine-protein kinase PknB n=2 Tax=Novipirellula aureliae TaxID=2527966 RepID=A0A5C6E652_9BACT|nr:Serine/threonine-protein kinase PknB [Novipirellula aureliae]